MKPQHATFILQMIKHGDKLRAYRAAYPKAKGQSAIKAAERLLRRPEIAEEIQAVVQDIRSQTVIEAYQVMKQEQQVRILSVMKKREILNQIATCEMKVGRWIKDEDGYRMVYEDPRPRDIILAIDKDTKLEEACNRMRDITDVKLSRYDIYIDGRPCDNPNAPINPDIPMGLIMLPKKQHASSFPTVARNEAIREGGTSVASTPAPHFCGGRVDEGYPEAEQFSNENPGNKKEQNEETPLLFLGGDIGKNVEDINLPIGVVDSRKNEPSCNENSHSQDLILNENSGNKKEQNMDNSPFEEPVPPQREGGAAGGGGCPLAQIHTNHVVLPLGEIEDPHDYLTLKKQHLSEKRQRCENDPMSESFYKIFTRERDAIPPPHILTDEEIEAIKNEEERKQPNEESSLPQIKDFTRQQLETKKPAYCGKMYFPEKQPQPGDDITNDKV